MHSEKNWLVGRDGNDFLKPTQTIQTVLYTHKLKYFVGLSWSVKTGYQHFLLIEEVNDLRQCEIDAMQPL